MQIASCNSIMWRTLIGPQIDAVHTLDTSDITQMLHCIDDIVEISHQLHSLIVSESNKGVVLKHRAVIGGSNMVVNDTSELYVDLNMCVLHRVDSDFLPFRHTIPI